MGTEVEKEFPVVRFVLDLRQDVTTPSSWAGEKTAEKFLDADLLLEPEIFDQVQLLYHKAAREKDPELEVLAKEAELASQILTLTSPKITEESLVWEALVGFKQRYQVTLHQLLGIALTPYREEITADGRRFGRPLCSIQELTEVLAELRNFGGLLTLVESGQLCFQEEDLSPLNRIFGRRSREKIFWSAYASNCQATARELAVLEDCQPILPPGLRVVVWLKPVVDFERTLSNPSQFAASESLFKKRRGRRQLLDDFDRQARKIFPIGKIWENDLGCERSRGGLAILATDNQGNSSRLIAGLTFENNSLAMARARLPCLERLTEGMKDKFGVLPNLAGVLIRMKGDWKSEVCQAKNDLTKRA